MQRNPKFDDSIMKSIDAATRQAEKNKDKFFEQLGLASLAASSQRDDE